MQRPVLARAAEGSSGLRPHARPAVVAGKNGGATPFAPSPRPSRCLPLRPRRPTWFAWVGRADAGAQRALPRIEGLRGKGHPRPVQGRNRGAQIAYGARGAHGASPYALLPSTSGGSGALLPSIDQRAQRHAGDAIAVLALQPRPGRFGTTQAVSRTASVQAPQPRARRGPPAPIKPPAPAPQSVQRWAPLSEGGSKGAHAAAHSGAIARRLRTSGLPPVWGGRERGGSGPTSIGAARPPRTRTAALRRRTIGRRRLARRSATGVAPVLVAATIAQPISSHPLLFAIRARAQSALGPLADGPSPRIGRSGARAVLPVPSCRSCPPPMQSVAPTHAIKQRVRSNAVLSSNAQCSTGQSGSKQLSSAAPSPPPAASRPHPGREPQAQLYS
jgi:hypothetical protein